MTLQIYISAKKEAMYTTVSSVSVLADKVRSTRQRIIVVQEENLFWGKSTPQIVYVILKTISMTVSRRSILELKYTLHTLILKRIFHMIQN